MDIRLYVRVELPIMILLNSHGKSILDLGCGTGHFSSYCIENGASKVIGVDISRNMIEQAKKDNNHEKIDYICIPIEDLDLPN